MDSQAVSSAFPSARIRSARYDEIYVSPHMDDAVYSCGGQIKLERAAGKRVLVVTVFGDAEADLARDTSALGVFRDTVQRRREEQAALARLDVDHVWLNYPDLLVRPKRLGELVRYALPFTSLEPDALQARLHAVLDALRSARLAAGGRLYFPLAIGAHPDHRVVHTVGEAIAARTDVVTFYEDVPYAAVAALRNERLQHLGASSTGPRLSEARESHDFAFAHAPRWQRPFTLLAVLGHAAVSKLAFRVLRDRTKRASPDDLRERDIHDVVHDKVRAMRDYVTQTAYFFPDGDALYDRLATRDGRYVERYWTLRSPRPHPALIEASRAFAEEAKAQVATL